MTWDVKYVEVNEGDLETVKHLNLAVTARQLQTKGADLQSSVSAALFIS